MVAKLTGRQASQVSLEICAQIRVIPVLSVTEIEDASPLAEALIEGGLNVFEVTLRTPKAFGVIKEMSKVKGSIVGVGTLRCRQDVEMAIEVGAKFGVSPGVTDDLVLACEEFGLPLIGGVSSVSEIMKMLSRGYTFLKFFPAEVSGGVTALNAISGPLPDALFFPTGGVSVRNAKEYLALKNVVCVGGSWIAKPKMIREKNWMEISRQANLASMLG